MATQKEFFKRFIPLCMVLGAVFVDGVANAAAVAKRGTSSRAQVAARAPVTAKTTVSQVEDEPEEFIEEVVVEEEEIFEFEDRTSQFDEALGGAVTATESSDNELAEMIRKQRAAADASSATATVKQNAKSAAVSGKNACDTGLRKCMQSKCGADFAKCAGDTDTTFGDKLDACRRDLKCSGHEYSVFTAEIKADRDANAELANFNAIINCGNKYNSCILAECGTTFSKCLGKSEGDKAINKCKKIQNECTQLDNGLASRMMNVFAGVRQDAEKQVQRDEQRLYDLRDEMENVCRRMGAMFDNRSLDCVYTVNFFADNSSTPYASKKAYAGGAFNCDPGWFGIDVTTFKENAYRLTRAQTAASSAMLGSGLGMAAGAVTSGAIDRALETQKAKKELKEAEKDAEKPKDNDSDDDDAKPGAAGRRCTKAGGTWTNGVCTGAKCDDGKEWSDTKNKCVKTGGGDNAKSSKAQKRCEEAGGTWGEDGKCSGANCGDDKEWNDAKNKCVTQDCAGDCIICESAGGEWKKLLKKCRCKDASGKTKNVDNPKDCIVDTQEEEVVEEGDGLDTAGVVCGDLGGDWDAKSKKCKCKDIRGKSITTTNPVSDCEKQTENTAAAAKTEKKSKEQQPGDSKADKNQSGNDNQKTLQEACSAADGKIVSSGKCECKNKAGRTTRTGNPKRDCVKPAAATAENTGKTKGVAKSGTSKSDNSNGNADDVGGISGGTNSPCDIVATFDNKQFAMNALNDETAAKWAKYIADLDNAGYEVATKSGGMYEVRWNQAKCKEIVGNK